jgi:hypothetical protein
MHALRHCERSEAIQRFRIISPPAGLTSLNSVGYASLAITRSVQHCNKGYTTILPLWGSVPLQQCPSISKPIAATTPTKRAA